MQQIPDHPMIRQLERTGYPWPIRNSEFRIRNFSPGGCPKQSPAKRVGYGTTGLDPIARPGRGSSRGGAKRGEARSPGSNCTKA